MKTDGPVYPNPVRFSEPVLAEAYTSLLTTLPEYRFRNRIVGFTDEAVYACTGRNAKSGYYEMICEPFSWAEMQRVSYGRFFSSGSVLLGIGLIVLGVALFVAAWIDGTHTGTAVFWMPFAAPVAGLWLIFGSRRLRLIARTSDRKLWYVAPPFFAHEEELRERLGLTSGVESEKEVD